jgi:hypothetical protein
MQKHVISYKGKDYIVYVYNNLHALYTYNWNFQTIISMSHDVYLNNLISMWINSSFDKNMSLGEFISKVTSIRCDDILNGVR